MTRMLRTETRALIALALLTALVACDPGDPCDPGDYEEHGTCYPNEEADEPQEDASAGDGEDGGAEPEPPSDPYAGFGDECEGEGRGDCPNELTCGGDALPYCTQVNCIDDEDICPPGWMCLDVTGLSPDPNVTSICLQ